MDMQALFDMVSEKESYKRVAEGQNMSLGQLIDALSEIPNKNILVRADDAAFDRFVVRSLRLDRAGCSCALG